MTPVWRAGRRSDQLALAPLDWREKLDKMLPRVGVKKYPTIVHSELHVVRALHDVEVVGDFPA